jgi:hypothetical protein
VREVRGGRTREELKLKVCSRTRNCQCHSCRDPRTRPRCHFAALIISRSPFDSPSLASGQCLHAPRRSSLLSVHLRKQMSTARRARQPCTHAPRSARLHSKRFRFRVLRGLRRPRPFPRVFYRHHIICPEPSTSQQPSQRCRLDE